MEKGSGAIYGISQSEVNEFLKAPGATGATTPAAGTFSPVISKGPAIITTFAGTVTATASTTVTFSSAADAILAGYDATNPILGTTLISNALTRYIVSWTNATTCVVNLAVTWAGTAITSVQLPISTFVDSSGVTKGWMNAAGNVYFVDSVGIGTASPGTKLQIETAIAAYPLTITSGAEDIFKVRFAGAGNNLIYLGGSNILQKISGNLVLGDGVPNVGIGAALPTEKLHVTGNIKLAGTTGGFVRKVAEAVSAALSGASGSIAVNVPSGSRILGVQLRVDTLITSGDGALTWTAAYTNTPTTAICNTQAFTANTKFNAIHPAYEITTGTVAITITPNANTFSGGVVRAIVYYEALDTMASL